MSVEDRASSGSVRHIALVVPNLRAAEQFYQGVFDMQIIGREALLPDGYWYTLPFDKGWEDAKAASIDLGMVALRKGDFVLALFHGSAVNGQVYAIGLAMPPEDIVGVRKRLPQNAHVLEEGPAGLSFTDPYQVTWQISAPGNEFRTAGDFSQRWLQV